MALPLIPIAIAGLYGVGKVSNLIKEKAGLRKLTEQEDLILQRHKAWLQDEEGGEQANFSKMDLRKTGFAGANLEKADFSQANLKRADLSGANLAQANLEGANLKDADFSRTILTGANIENADLKGANLEDAIRYDAGMLRSLATHERLILQQHELWLQDENNGKQASFCQTDLCKADLQGVNLKKANLEEINLEGAKLEGACLSNASLRGANLQGANLQGANLESACLERANLRGANLIGANLNQANLKDATLWYANCANANLEGANLREANLEGGVHTRVNLKGADLSNANLKEANFAGANLVGADLTGANIEGANFEEAICASENQDGLGKRILTDIAESYATAGKVVGKAALVTAKITAIAAWELTKFGVTAALEAGEKTNTDIERYRGDFSGHSSGRLEDIARNSSDFTKKQAATSLLEEQYTDRFESYSKSDIQRVIDYSQNAVERDVAAKILHKREQEE